MFENGLSTTSNKSMWKSNSQPGGPLSPADLGFKWAPGKHFWKTANIKLVGPLSLKPPGLLPGGGDALDVFTRVLDTD